MGATGTNWYYEQLPIVPDILVFGKKAQVSGIMVTERYSTLFQLEGCKLEVTWDATLCDMIRCKYILEAYEDLDILKNVKDRSDQIVSGVTNPKIKNLRNVGLLIGFDFDSESERDQFQEKCYLEGLLVNKAGTNTIRLRPNLAVSPYEVEEALQILNGEK